MGGAWQGKVDRIIGGAGTRRLKVTNDHRQQSQHKSSNQDCPNQMHGVFEGHLIVWLKGVAAIRTRFGAF
jgi:hypothetical protein